MSKNNIITVFEHESLRINQKGLTKEHLNSLELFHDHTAGRYYTLIHNGVKFSEFVGAIQVGELLIEVLPKMDKKDEGNNSHWRDILIGMMKYSGLFQVHAPSSGNLNTKNNSILDLYFELFLTEVDSLLRMGLVKKYRQEESNKKSLRGKLLFSKNIQKNVIHKENFYTKATTYDLENTFNIILRETIDLIFSINKNPMLSGRIGDISLRFPELPSRKITEDTFERLYYDRKTEAYRPAIMIARLLLLNYHPNLMSGKNHVLALMFDMNLLWERFILVSLRRNISCFQKGTTIQGQSVKPFWAQKSGRAITIRPDIVLKDPSGMNFILDTKWKNLAGSKPSAEDLRQMYVYLDFFEARSVALVFPGDGDIREGNYYSSDKSKSELECGLLPISLNEKLSMWQEEISTQIANWISKKR